MTKREKYTRQPASLIVKNKFQDKRGANLFRLSLFLELLEAKSKLIMTFIFFSSQTGKMDRSFAFDDQCSLNKNIKLYGGKELKMTFKISLRMLFL